MVALFQSQTGEYEQIVGEANANKQLLREECSLLETKIREQRDEVADLQVENRNLQYVLDREQDAIDEKDRVEQEALQIISGDLQEQLQMLQDNSDKLTGKMTPFAMEQILSKKVALTNKQYDAQISENELQLSQTD